MHAAQRMLVTMDEDRSGQGAVPFLSERTGGDAENHAAMAARAAGRGSSRPHRRLNVATIDRSHGWARV